MDKFIQFPGVANAWTVPIKTPVEMLSTGIKTPIGIKVSGPDLNVLQALSQQIEEAIKTLPVIYRFVLQFQEKQKKIKFDEELATKAPPINPI